MTVHKYIHSRDLSKSYTWAEHRCTGSTHQLKPSDNNYLQYGTPRTRDFLVRHAMHACAVRRRLFCPGWAKVGLCERWVWRGSSELILAAKSTLYK